MIKGFSCSRRRSSAPTIVQYVIPIITPSILENAYSVSIFLKAERRRVSLLKYPNRASQCTLCTYSDKRSSRVANAYDTSSLLPTSLTT